MEIFNFISSLEAAQKLFFDSPGIEFHSNHFDLKCEKGVCDVQMFCDTLPQRRREGNNFPLEKMKAYINPYGVLVVDSFNKGKLYSRRSFASIEAIFDFFNFHFQQIHRIYCNS